LQSTAAGEDENETISRNEQSEHTCTTDAYDSVCLRDRDARVRAYGDGGKRTLFAVMLIVAALSVMAGPLWLVFGKR